MSACYFTHKINEECEFKCPWKGNEFDNSLGNPNRYMPIEKTEKGAVDA